MKLWVKIIIIAKLQINRAIAKLDEIIQKRAVSSFFDCDGTEIIAKGIFDLMEKKERLIELYDIYKSFLCECDKKERLVFECIANRVTQEAMANELMISRSTVCRLIKKTMDKLVLTLKLLLGSPDYIKARYSGISIIDQLYFNLAKSKKTTSKNTRSSTYEKHSKTQYIQKAL